MPKKLEEHCFNKVISEGPPVDARIRGFVLVQSYVTAIYSDQLIIEIISGST